MTALGVALLVVTAFDPTVVASRLAGAEPGPRRTGAAAGAAVGVVVVWAARPLLEGLRIEPESFWIAAGLVLAVSGLVRVAVPLGVRPLDVGELRRWWYPIAYPVVLRPELVLAALAGGAHDAAIAASLAIAAAAAFAALCPHLSDVLASALSRLAAALQVALAIALVVDGIRGV